MTPEKWLQIGYTVLRDAAILFGIWWIWHAGGNSVKLEDVKATQKQVQAIADSFNTWQKADTLAKEKQDATIKDLNDRIDKQPPIIVRLPAAAPSAGTLPRVPAGGSAGGLPAAGRSSGRSGGDSDQGKEDLRPDVNAVERKYSKAIAECRRIFETCKVPR